MSEKFWVLKKTFALAGEKRAGQHQRNQGAKRAHGRELVFEGIHTVTFLIEIGGGHTAPSHKHLITLYLLPQHRSVPVFTSLLSTPFIAFAAISVTPVSV